MNVDAWCEIEININPKLILSDFDGKCMVGGLGEVQV
jgi:hypothetical protein